MLTFVDLFSGAGGFTLGLCEAGLTPVGAVECDRFAAATYRHNFPTHTLLERDIQKIASKSIRSAFGGVDVVVAGPPCQGFSVAGPSQYGKIDPRNKLLLEVFRFVKLLKPRFFVVENVKGILSGKLSKRTNALQVFAEAADQVGYSCKIFTLQAADFGVPQWRERVFLIGARDAKALPQSVGHKELKGWRTVSMALSDLPLIDSGQGTETHVAYSKKPANPFQKWLRSGSSGVANHVAMKHTPRLLSRFEKIPVGGSLVDVPAEHGQRVRNGHKLDVRQRFKMNNQRLDPSRVSLAVTASFQSNFVHPHLHRNLTAREGARLQSFPDRFYFCGPRTLMSKTLLLREGRKHEIGLSQYNQIGNAVPPLLAKAIGELLLEQT
jgi:DNA (cytosine-5)-methyltransferase 1